MEELTILKQRKPEVAHFLEQWRAKNERQVFDLEIDSGQADFYEALQDLGRHIAHCSSKVTISTVVSVDGVNTVYLNVVPTPVDDQT